MTAGSTIRCAQLIERLDVGGAEILAVRIANALASRGHKSHIVVIGRAGEVARRARPEVTIHELEFDRESITRPWAFARSLHSGRNRIRSILRGCSIDVVQSHLPGANFWGLLLTLGGQRGVLPTIHNNQEFNYGDSDNRVRARARRGAYGAMARHCPAMVAVSDEVKRSLVADCALDEATARRIVVVSNGVEVRALESKPSRDAVRRAFGLDPDDFVFLAAGRHCRQKNFADLIRAARLLPIGASHSVIVIAGDGPDRPALESEGKDLVAAGRLRFAGTIANLQDLMWAADAFVLPSLWEGLPLVLLEAMAEGLPVIGNRIPGVVDVVEDWCQGLLTEPGNPNDLSLAMATMMRDPAARASLSREAQARVLSDFDFRATVEQLERVYFKVAGRCYEQEL